MTICWGIPHFQTGPNTIVICIYKMVGDINYVYIYIIFIYYICTYMYVPNYLCSSTAHSYPIRMARSIDHVLSFRRGQVWGSKACPLTTPCRRLSPRIPPCQRRRWHGDGSLRHGTGLEFKCFWGKLSGSSFGESLEVQLLAGAGNQPDEMVLAENYKQGTSILSMLVGD